MADLWEETLVEAQIDDVSFPVRARGFTTGRDGARIRRPYQDGQEFDDTGRKPMTFKLSIELFADVDESHYPGLYSDLIDVITRREDGAPPLRYTDPVLGMFDVCVLDMQVDEDAMVRNGATVALMLEEVTTADATFIVPPRAPGRAAIEWAADLDDSLGEANVTEANVTEAWDAADVPATDGETGSFTDLVGSVQETLGTAASVVSEVERAVDLVRQRVSAVLGLEAVAQGAEVSWGVRASGYLLLDALGEQADRAVASAVPIEERVLADSAGVYDLALSQYGDARRVSEILRRNPAARPWAYRAGTTIRMAAR